MKDFSWYHAVDRLPISVKQLDFTITKSDAKLKNLPGYMDVTEPTIKRYLRMLRQLGRPLTISSDKIVSYPKGTEPLAPKMESSVMGDRWRERESYLRALLLSEEQPLDPKQEPGPELESTSMGWGKLRTSVDCQILEFPKRQCRK